MAYPAGITSKLVTGTFADFYQDKTDGTIKSRPKKGYVLVSPAPDEIRINATNVIYDLTDLKPQRVAIDVNGTFTFEAIVTDQAGITPNNAWTYKFEPSWGSEVAYIPIRASDPATININQYFGRAEVPGVVETQGPAGRGIASITSVGTIATITYTDGSTGTFSLPIGDGSETDVPDATNAIKGKILIAGDLTGSATNIVIGADKIDSTKLSPAVRTSLGKADTAIQAAGLTKAAVGLGNVDNTSDLNKPVSNATQSALNLKVNITSLHAVATSGSYADLTNKPTIPSTKADIGLGNVDNTSDLNKPISTATASALAGKASTTHTHSEYIKTVNGTSPDGTGAVTVVIDWAALTGKPTTFAPSAHTHLWADITDKPTTFTPATHAHAQSDITGLATTLAGKSDTTHVHAYSSLTGIPSTFAPSAHTHTAANISDSTTIGRSILLGADAASIRTIIGAGTSNLALGSTASTAAAGNHVHAYSSLTGIPSTFAPSAHAHIVADVTGLQAALDGKAATVHTHATSDVTNLDTLLAGKANVSALTSKADLDGNGWVPTSQLPPRSLIRSVPVADIAAMQALTAADVQEGDVAVVTSMQRSYMFKGGDPSNLDNWNQLSWAPGSGGSTTVQTVNGQVGDVVLGKSDVGLANVDNTSDLNKPISTAVATALAGKASSSHTHDGVYEPVISSGTTSQFLRGDKTFTTISVGNVTGAAPLASPTFTGTVSGITKAMVGLGNVDNTSDVNKPVSTAQAASIATKAPLGYYQKASGDVTTGVLDWSNDSSVGYLLHFTTGANSSASNAAIAIGTDKGAAAGILISHKNTGTGLSISAQPGAGSAIQVTGRSSVGFPIRVMSKPGSMPVSLRADSGAGYADGSVTNGSAVLTSATAAFVAGDQGKAITQITSKGGTDPLGTIPNGTTILSVDSATQVTMSAAATSTTNALLFEVAGRLVPDSQALLSVQDESSATYTTLSKQGVSIKGTLTNISPLIVSRKASQTAAISQWRDESFNVLSYIGKNGHIGTNVTTTLVAADLGTSTMAFYLDPTAGSPKMKVVGKDSGGTVFDRAVILDNDTRLTDARTPSAHVHATSDVTGLDSALTSKAPIASPTFTGTPSGPTATAGTNTTQLATTAYVVTGLSGKANTSHTHLWADITDKPTTFTPSTHSHAQSDITGLTASLAAKENSITAGTNAQYYRGDKTWQTLDKAAVGLSNVDNTSDLTKFANTALTGVPTAPTATAGTNTTQLATTAYVVTGLAGKANSTHTHAQADITNLVSDLALKAPLANPNFTGTVTGVTKGMVGLGSVDNTSDVNKPVSNAQAAMFRFNRREDYRPMPVARVSFADKANGILPNFDTGQTPVVGLNGVNPVTSNGRLVATGTGNRASYYSTPSLGANVTRVGARFVFIPQASSTFAGTACVAITNIPMDSQNTSLKMALHFWTTRYNWAVTVWDGSAGGQSVVVSEYYAAPLPTDGITEMTMEAWIIGNKCVFVLPDGQKREATDTRFNTFAGQYAFVETYVPTGATDDIAAFSHFWVDTAPAVPSSAPAVNTADPQTINGYKKFGVAPEAPDPYSGPQVVNRAYADTRYAANVLTGYVSSPGTVAATDTVLQAIQKLNGNDGQKAPIANPTFTGTVSGITATMVGLGNVNNTSDAAKPISTATQTALDLKANRTDNQFVTYGTNTTLTMPASPVNGQMTLFEIRATAAITVTAAAGTKLTGTLTNTLAIGSGKSGFMGFRYSTAASAWYLLSSVAEA